MYLGCDGEFDDFRRVARLAVLHHVRPEAVQFVDRSSGQRAFFEGSLPETEGQVRTPRSFVELGRVAALHASDTRWDTLYRVLFRFTHGEPELLDRPTDPDVRALQLLASAVRRDIHKMHSFLRFRKVETEDGDVTWAAFYEPDHRILAEAAPFFVSRFGSEPFVIVTPHASATWDCEELVFGRGLSSRDAAFAPFFEDKARENELVDLFRTYYSHLFNPARRNERAMRREMPVRFWKHMPETLPIAELLAAAPARTGDMIAEVVPEPAPPARTLVELGAHAARCTACPIHHAATQTVFGHGNPRANIALVGEQPGDEEDRRGEPFVGPAGQMLRTLMDEAGLPANDVYLTNAVKHFGWEPRGKHRLHKKPRYSEVVTCRKWLEAELELLRPKVIVCLGVTAAQSLLGPGFKLSQARDKFIPQPWASALIATYHPSAILRMRDDEAAKARDQLKRDLVRARLAAGESR